MKNRPFLRRLPEVFLDLAASQARADRCPSSMLKWPTGGRLRTTARENRFQNKLSQPIIRVKPASNVGGENRNGDEHGVISSRNGFLQQRVERHDFSVGIAPLRTRPTAASTLRWLPGAPAPPPSRMNARTAPPLPPSRLGQKRSASDAGMRDPGRQNGSWPRFRRMSSSMKCFTFLENKSLACRSSGAPAAHVFFLRSKAPAAVKPCQ